MITPVRQPAKKIFIREAEYGPEVCFDYGPQRTVVNCTEGDLKALETALMLRRMGILRSGSDGEAVDTSAVDTADLMRLLEQLKLVLG